MRALERPRISVIPVAPALPVVPNRRLAPIDAQGPDTPQVRSACARPEGTRAHGAAGAVPRAVVEGVVFVATASTGFEAMLGGVDGGEGESQGGQGDCNENGAHDCGRDGDGCC